MNNNAEDIHNMPLEEFNVYPAITVNNLDEVNEQINDPNLSVYDFVVGDYMRVYLGNDQMNVRMYEIKKCAEYLGTINTQEQFFEEDYMDTTPDHMTPPPSPGHTSNAAIVSPSGGKRTTPIARKERKGKKSRKLQKNRKTRKKKH